MMHTTKIEIHGLDKMRSSLGFKMKERSKNWCRYRLLLCSSILSTILHCALVDYTIILIPTYKLR